MKKLKYLCSCITCPEKDLSALQKCIDDAKEISRRTFLYRVPHKDLQEHAYALGYARHHTQGMTMAADSYVKYYRSTFKGELCYFFVWSGIEQLYV